MAAEQYLDDNGLLYYHTRLLQTFVEQGDEGDENTIETVKVNNTPLIPDANKAVNVQVPTTIAGMSDAADWATKQYVNTAIGSVAGITFEIVQSLPQAGDASKIYLISNSGTNPNIYDEYIYVNNAWEKIGTTDIDLSGYVQTSDLGSISNTTIDAILAGTYSG